MRVASRFGLLQFRRVRSALKSAALLATVAMVTFSPLLLDDFVLQTAYLLRSSADAVTIRQPTVLIEQPRLVALSGTLSVPPALSGNARTGEALAALVKGGSARLALKAPALELDLSGPAREDVYGGDLVAGLLSPLMAALEDTAFESLIIRDGILTVRGDASFEETLTEVNVEVGVKRKSAVRIKGSAKLRGETIGFDATFGARIGRRGTTRTPVKAVVQNGLISVTLDGRIDTTSGLQLLASSAEIVIPNLRSVARWLGAPSPQGAGLRDFAARGAFDWAGRRIAFPNGTFRMDGNEARGTLALAFGGPRPSIAGTLALSSADLSPYLARAEPEPDLLPPPTGLIGRLKGVRELGLPFLTALDADLRLSAETVSAGASTLEGAAASMALRDGRLLLNIADVVLPGGAHAGGEIVVDGSAAVPQFGLNSRIESVDLTVLSKIVSGVELARGTGTARFDFTSSGLSGMDALSRLNGSVDADLPDGGGVPCTLRSAATLSLPNGEGCRGWTTLAPMTAKASLVNGVATLDHIEGIASTGHRMRLDGTVDLVTRVVDLTLSATPAEPRTDVSDLDAALVRAMVRSSEHLRLRGRPDALTVEGAQP
jgi:hypothetical protein